MKQYNNWKDPVTNSKTWGTVAVGSLAVGFEFELELPDISQMHRTVVMLDQMLRIVLPYYGACVRDSKMDQPMISIG